MRWNCPHCQTELYSTANDTQESTPGWLYGRCSSCSGFAAIDSSTGAAVKIQSKAKTEPAPTPQTPILAQQPHVIEAQLIQGPVSTRRALAQHQEAVTQAAVVRPRRGASVVLSLATAALAMGSAVALGQYLFNTTKPEVPRLARATAAAQKITPPPAVTAPPAVTTPPEVLLANRPISDSIHATAMAPTRIEPPGLTAHARKGARSIEMRDGPGDEFALTGLADLQGNYTVLEWKNRWFKILLNESGKTAWVHHDGIDLTSHDQQRSKKL